MILTFHDPNLYGCLHLLSSLCTEGMGACGDEKEEMTWASLSAPVTCVDPHKWGHHIPLSQTQICIPFPSHHNELEVSLMMVTPHTKLIPGKSFTARKKEPSEKMVRICRMTSYLAITDKKV